MRGIWRAALAAVDPAACLARYLPGDRPAGRTLVLGAGKAAAAMAVAAHHQLSSAGIRAEGAVVTRHGHGLLPGESTGAIEVLEAGHPVPDEASLRAGSRLLDLARSARPGDRLLALLSGGASSLLVQPLPPVTLADKQAVTRSLLASGAAIDEINLVRRELSMVKNGGLACAAASAEIRVFAISDVPGDAIADIGSGPFAPARGSRAEARAILDRHGIDPGPRIAALLGQPVPARGSTPLRVTSTVIARSEDALRAAAGAATAAGYDPLLLPEVRGEARLAAAEHAIRIRELRRTRRRFAVISGGETAVTLGPGAARGGRNGEYLLALAIALGAEDGVHALAADTDGLDGAGDNAGAFLSPDSLTRAAGAGIDVTHALASHASLDVFTRLGDLHVTGPTRTNVNDLRVVLVD